MGSTLEIVPSHQSFAKLSSNLSTEEEREARKFLRELSIEIMQGNKTSSSPGTLIVSSKCPAAALNLADDNPGWRIIGVEVLRHCVQENINLPQRKTPVLTCQLKTAFICFSSLSSEEKLRLSRLAECMGGNVCPGLSLDVTHLVAENLESTKCQFVLEHAKKGKSLVRIVNKNWLNDCWDFRHKLPKPSELEYLLPVDIFRGMRMSCTGFEIDERTNLSRLAKRFGATFKTDLDSRCTHLIAHTPSGTKYNFAVRRGIPVVSSTWLIQSCLRYTCLPCDYDFNEGLSQSQSATRTSAHSTPAGTQICDIYEDRSSQNEGLVIGKSERAGNEECSFFEDLKFYFPSELSANECRELGIFCR
jgi:hypothetical protein